MFHSNTLILILLVLITTGYSQTYYPVPRENIQKTSDGYVLISDTRTLTYVQGLGWLSDAINSPLLLTNNLIYAPEDVFEALELKASFLKGIRYGISEKERVVLDVSNFASRELANLKQSGKINQILTIDLPRLLLPLELQETGTVTLSTQNDKTLLNIETEAQRYELFGLENPQRIVIDLYFEKADPKPDYPLPEEALFDTGVSYRRISVNGSTASSIIHIATIDRNSGSFKVVGQKQHGLDLEELAQGAFAAINAGYFDPQSFRAIGLLKIDYGLLSLPSRKRASVGISETSIHLDRLEAWLELYGETGLIYKHNLADANSMHLHQEAEQWVGNPGVGVLTVYNGIIVENKIGPRQVPGDGYAIVYSPGIRELALLDPGDRLYFKTTIHPEAFQNVPYAVEAGPLLIKDYAVVLNPQLEQFQTGARILDAVTLQSVLALSENNVYFIVAERMNVADLLPFLESLGVRDAIRLDSGSSSALVIDNTHVNKGSLRKLSSAIVFIPHK